MVTSTLRRPMRSLEVPEPMPWRAWLARPVRRLAARLVLPRFDGLPRRRPRSFGELRHVAVVHWDNLGDAVLLGPVLRELRRELPEARIVLVHNERNTGFFAHCPHVDELVSQRVQVPPAAGEAHGASVDSRTCVLEAARILRDQARRHGPVDLVIGPDWLNPVYTESFFESALFRAGGGRRLLRAARRAGRAVDVAQRQHHVARNLEILRALGGSPGDDHLESWITDAEHASCDALLSGASGSLVAMSVGAGSAKRRWPVDRMADVADVLAGDGATVVLVGGPEARPLVDGACVGAFDGALDLVGQTSIGELGAVLGRCSLLVGNDSGPIHLAAANGTPVVEVSMHPMDGEPWIVNSPARYHPWGVRSVVLRPEKARGDCSGAKTCRGPDAHCILGVGVDDVVDAARLLLGDAVGSSGS